MTDSITPPPGLVQQWYDEARDASLSTPKIEKMVATRAAQWGADQELEACCLWVNSVDDDDCFGANLRAARRPKPPSLKEQALGLLNEGPVSELLDYEVETIRRALEALPE